MNQFKKFCTGSETNCTKGKIELQHIHVYATMDKFRHQYKLGISVVFVVVCTIVQLLCKFVIKHYSSITVFIMAVVSMGRYFIILVVFVFCFCFLVQCTYFGMGLSGYVQEVQ